MEVSPEYPLKSRRHASWQAGSLGRWWVVLSDSPLPRAVASPAAAKAWMETGQYAQLKTMLLSLSYS